MISDDLRNICTWMTLARRKNGGGLRDDQVERLEDSLFDIFLRARLLESGEVPRSLREEMDLTRRRDVCILDNYRSQDAGEDKCRNNH